MKRTICLLLALAMLSAASCGGSSAGEDTTTPSADNTGETQSNRLTEMGAKNFDGRKFTILDANDHPEMHVNMPGETMNGDIVNDCLYERDAYIEEQYGVDIEYVQVTKAKDGTTQLKNNVLAGDDTYTLCISTVLGGTLGTIATEGVLMNLCDVDWLSLDQKWWSSLMYDSLRLNDTMYYTTGDISPTMYQMAGASFLNKKLLADYQIDTDFCQLVRDGKWTLDEVYAITKDLNKDVDEDNVMHVDTDYFGFIHQSLGGLTTNLLLTSAGLSLSEITDDGKSLSSDPGSEKTLQVIEKLERMLVETKWANSNDIINKAFKEDRAMVLVHYTESAAVHLRDMQSDYLVLPLPKYDENQETYRSFVNAWADAFVAIPATSDPEFAGFITEAMGYYSYENIRPKAYELTYKQKAVRDEDSAEMLDIIFDTIYLDFNCIYNFGKITDELTKVMKGTSELASAMASIEKAAQAEIDSFVENWG